MRLVEQASREIEQQVRIAQRALVEHAADLSVSVAETKIKRDITDDDQVRLVTAYLDAGDATMSERGDAARYARELFDVSWRHGQADTVADRARDDRRGVRATMRRRSGRCFIRWCRRRRSSRRSAASRRRWA